MVAHRGEVIVFIVAHEAGAEECAVSFEALCDLGRVNRNDVSQDELFRIFHTHREEIEAAALKKFRAGVYNKPGGILVTSGDLSSA
jgi:hypothetical protein